ncbi:MAG: flagellar basal body rod protein FlgC [Myxococcota bacterium]
MNVFSAMEIAGSGLNAQRTRMNTLASNLANARTTQTEEGGPYRRLDPVFRAVPVGDRFENLDNGRSAYLVEVPEIRADEADPQRMYDPNHPDADDDGYVALPNVNVVEEMVNMVTAARAYESGVTLMQSLKGMAQSALSIGA